MLELGNRAPGDIEYTTAPSLYLNYAATTGYHVGPGVVDPAELTGLGEAGFARSTADRRRTSSRAR